MWTVLIADDEPAARRGVRQLLAPYAGNFTVVGECRDGRETLRALDALDPDVLFLDIQMPEIDGFEVIRRRTTMPAVVFLTAYDEFAIRAFEAEALDYLLKPVSEERFAATIDRLARRLRSGDASIAVATTRGFRVVPLAEIDWIEAADNYARLWVGERSYLLRRSLADLEKRVTAHGFARAHRQALIRVAGVRALEELDGELVAVLASGVTIRVSRRRRAAFAAAVRRQLSS
ncbi:MAG TPA: LytTR family DNA-binding domain-containing protein [Thermoanaerobaculia bacterium]